MADIYFNKDAKTSDDYTEYNERGDFDHYEDIDSGRKRPRRNKNYNPNDYAYNSSGRRNRAAEDGDISFDRSRNTTGTASRGAAQSGKKSKKKKKNKGQTQPSNVRYVDNREPSVQKKNRKKKGCGCGCGTILVVLIVLAVLYGIVAETVFAGLNYDASQHGSNAYVTSSSLRQDPMITNILLVGDDAREEMDEDSARSDTMMLVSIDRKHRKIKLTSFLRDSYVDIPGHGYDKLNAANSYGGIQLVIDTLEYNYGIKIDKYVSVGFEAFTELIDGVGGVDVAVTEKEADYLNQTWYKWSLTHKKVTFESGDSVHLDGEKALMFCRIRYLDSDIERTRRQRLVIAALKEKLTSTNPFKLLSVAQAICPNITTDINKFRLEAMGIGAVLWYRTFDIESISMPMNWYNETNEKGDVIAFDVDEAAYMLKQFIYKDTDPSEISTTAYTAVSTTAGTSAYSSYSSTYSTTSYYPSTTQSTTSALTAASSVVDEVSSRVDDYFDRP